MKRFCCRLIVHGCIAALLTVALYSWLVAGTSAPPQPSFSVRTEPRFWFRTWPGDFNRDGRTDLIAGGRTLVNQVPRLADLLVSMGRGDGTFTSPQPLGIAAQPLGTGDFNRDSRLDVVVLGADATLSVLPGNGDGTFGTPVRIASVVATAPFASITDFDRDGHRDIAVGTDEVPNGGHGVLLFPGRGDFTFDPPMHLPVSHNPVMEGINGDFNKDGRRDLAVVASSSLFVFINRGRLAFEPREIRLSRPLADITTADVNRDTKLDLLIAASGGSKPTSDDNSRVLVLLGDGYGAFGQPQVYDTGVKGESTIVAGDFNRDGRIDVATGTRSVHHDDQFGYQVWDSVSVMPGDGTGRLRGATTYTLGRSNQQLAEHALSHNALNTSDLNGDRQTDLIASPGAILLNQPTATNRGPTIFAGLLGS